MPRSLPLKPTEHPLSSKANNAEKVKVTKLLHAIVSSIHARANVYHWKIGGDSLECLSELLGCSHLVMCHILSMCDLYDTEKHSYRSVDDNWEMFEPCQLIASHLKHYDSSKKKTRASKHWFLRIGAKPGRMKGPLHQYSLTAGRDNNKYHKLLYGPSRSRTKNEADAHKPKLHKDELSMVKHLLELATNSMKIKDNICDKPNTQSSQHNSKKGDQFVRPHQAKHSSVTDQAIISQFKKELDAFIMMDGKLSHDRVILISKFLQYTSKTLNGMIGDSIQTPTKTVA